LKNFKKIYLSVLIILLITNFGYASLSIVDHDNMMKHLKILNEQGWVDNSKNICNNIISRSSYDWLDWKEFFAEFYSENIPTKHLWNYLGYPAYHWFDNKIHYNVQRSNIEIFSGKIDSLFNRYNNFLATSMVQDTVMRESIFVYTREFAGMINRPQSVIEDSIKVSMIDSVEKWIDLYPKFFKKNRQTEPQRLPYVGYLRWQLASILIDYYDFTEENIDHIITKMAIDFVEKDGLVVMSTNKGISVLKSQFSETRKDFPELNIFPMPFKLPAAKDLVIEGLLPGSEVKIITLDGTFIRHLTEKDGNIIGTQAFWDGRNKDGRLVSSGIYICMAYTEEGKNVAGKIAVIRGN